MFSWKKKGTGAGGAAGSASSSPEAVITIKPAILDLPPQEVVDSMFTQLFMSRGMDEAKTAAIRASHSHEQKWAMVKASQAMAKPAVGVEQKSPEKYVMELKTGMEDPSVELLSSLKVQLSTCPRDWLTKFTVAGGLAVLSDLIKKQLSRPK